MTDRTPNWPTTETTPGRWSGPRSVCHEPSVHAEELQKQWRKIARRRYGVALAATKALILTVPLAFLSASATLAGATTLFGLVNTGELHASTDAGVTWTIRSALPVRDAVALAAGSASHQLFLASESGSFYRSDDAGANWSAVSAIEASDVMALISSPGRLLLLTRRGSAHASVDSGDSWSAVGTITASDLVSAARSGTHDVALTQSGTVYRSLDDGASWSAIGTISVSNAVELIMHEDEPYVLTATGDVARSDDQGETWSFVGTLSQVGMTALLSTGAELLASTEGGECAASEDGVAWTWRGAIGQLVVTALGSDSPTTGVVEGSPADRTVIVGSWPNPAINAVSLVLDLERESVVTMGVYDAKGRRMAEPLVGERLPAGRTIRVWEPRDLPSGTYFVRARVGNVSQTQRVIWLHRR